MAFPTSITEKGDRVAAIVSINGEGIAFYPEWLRIKSLAKDKVEQEIDLVDPELSWKLEFHCDDLPACIPDVQRRVDAANAVLGKDRWRPFPCIMSIQWNRPERMGPGCELLWKLTFDFKDPRLIISREGRPLVTRSLPAWSLTHRHPACKGTIETNIESIAFDPESGLFVIGLSFEGAEGGGECHTPVWDFHPIRLPMFRSEVLQKRDGGAP